MGFMRSRVHYYTQISPLKNGGHTVWMDYKEKIRNLHETTGAMGFMMSLLNYHTQITPLEKQGPHSYGLHAKYSEICTRLLGQWVWWGPFFHYYTQITPWKTGTTQFDWITSNKFRNLNVIIVSMGFMSSLLHYYIQITPLQSEGYTVWMDYMQQILKIAQNHWGNGFYEVPFPLLHTNLLFGKWGPHSLNGLQAKNFELCTKPLR